MFCGRGGGRFSGKEEYELRNGALSFDSERLCSLPLRILFCVCCPHHERTKFRKGKCDHNFSLIAER